MKQSSSFFEEKKQVKSSSRPMANFQDCVKAFILGLIAGAIVLLTFPSGNDMQSDISSTVRDPGMKDLFEEKALRPHPKLPSMSEKHETTKTSHAIQTDDYAEAYADVLAQEDDEIFEEKMEKKPNPETQKTKPALDLEAFQKAATRSPTAFPTTMAPTVYQCRSEPEKGKVRQGNIKVEDLRIFIAEGVAQETAKLYNCMFGMFEMDINNTEFQLEELLRVAGVDISFEHILADYRIMQTLKSLPNRVSDINEADFVVLDIPALVSFSMPQDDQFECSKESHETRMARYFAILQDTGLVSSYKPMFLSLNYPIGSKMAEKILGSDIYNTFLLEKKTLVSTSNAKVYWKTRKQASKYAFVTPQIVNPYMSFSENLSPPWERKTVFYLDEVFVSETKFLKDISKMLLGGMGGDKNHLKIKSSERSFIDQRKIRAHDMQNSAFCLVLNGVDNTPAKSRVVDVLSSGCIPIFLEVENGKKTTSVGFPYPLSIDWGQVGFAFSSLACIDEFQQQTLDEFKAIEQLLSLDEGKEILGKMQLYGQQSLDYLLQSQDEESFARALLLEITNNL